MTSLASGKYISLETVRHNGTPVRTPVWFAAAPETGCFYVYSKLDSGKVKRIRRNALVRVAPCDMRGGITGVWNDASARLVTGDLFDQGMTLLNQKYWPWKQIGDFFVRLTGNQPRAVIEISFRTPALATTTSMPAHT